MATIPFTEFIKKSGGQPTAVKVVSSGGQPVQEQAMTTPASGPLGTVAGAVKNYASDVATSIGADLDYRDKKFAEQGARYRAGEQGLPLTLVQGVGQGFGAGAHAVEQLFSQIPGIKQGLDTFGKGINVLATSEFSPAKKLGDLIGQSKDLQDLVQKYDTDPKTRDTIDAVANAVRLGLDLKSALDTGTSIAKFGNKLLSSTPKPPVTVTPAEASVAQRMIPRAVPEEEILTRYTKAVKPATRSKSTAGIAAQYDKNTINAVNTIVENKQNLKFVTDAGEEVGRLPRTLGDFASSIDQTKAKIYQQYDDIATKAGGQGAKVSFEKPIAELDRVLSNKAIQVSHPEAIKYAESLKDRLTSTGSIDTKTAQELIQNYNSSLESFYRNPSYDTASRAAIDAGIVKSLREELDAVIESTTGEQYQALKNQYSAMKAIEKDVRNRANVVARQNNKGLIDYTDIFSGGDIVSGVLTLDPTLFVRGAAQKGIKEFFKYLNSPDRAIKILFENAESNYLSRNSSNISTPSQINPTTTATGQQSTNSINQSNTSIPENIPSKPKKVNMQSGMIRNPFYRAGKSFPKTVDAADIGDLRDFTDMVAGTYRPKSPEALTSAVLEASVHYGIITDKQAANIGQKTLSSKITKSGLLSKIDK